MIIKIKEVKQSFISPGIITPDQHIFGSGKVQGVVLRRDGQWPLSVGEKQSRNGLDTFACVTFALINSVVSIIKELFGIDVNYSERFVATGSGTDPAKGGNDPQKVAEWARHNGFVDEAVLPFDSSVKTLADYYADLMGETLKKGKEWLKNYTLRHDWLSEGNLITIDNLKAGLTYCPPAIALYAWAFDEERKVYVRPEHAKDIHMVELRGYVDGKYWIIKDSYPEDNEEIIQENMAEFNLPREKAAFIKKLDWNYPLYFAKRYVITKAIQKKSLWTWLQELIKELFK